jgi:hypothetical protein
MLHRPRGSSLRARLCCPGPSSLNRPHPPHSWAQHNFIALRLICAAFAVRERLGNPRVVPGFRCTLLPDMPSSMTPGSSNVDKFQSSSLAGNQRCPNSARWRRSRMARSCSITAASLVSRASSASARARAIRADQAATGSRRNVLGGSASMPGGINCLRVHASPS